MLSKPKIKFTTHALNKIKVLRKHGFSVTKSEIENTLLYPENLDDLSDKPNLIASKDFDQSHVLRVVYRLDDGIMIVITFYPAEKGRYY